MPRQRHWCVRPASPSPPLPRVLKPRGTNNQWHFLSSSKAFKDPPQEKPQPPGGSRGLSREGSRHEAHFAGMDGTKPTERRGENCSRSGKATSATSGQASRGNELQMGLLLEECFMGFERDSWRIPQDSTGFHMGSNGFRGIPWCETPGFYSLQPGWNSSLYNIKEQPSEMTPATSPRGARGRLPGAVQMCFLKLDDDSGCIRRRSSTSAVVPPSRRAPHISPSPPPEPTVMLYLLPPLCLSLLSRCPPQHFMPNL